MQLKMLGHSTYGKLLIDYFATSQRCEMRRQWVDEDQDPPSLLIRRLLCKTRLPRWLGRKSEIDFSLLRRELGYAYVGRKQADRAIKMFDPDILHFNTQSAALLSLDLMDRYPTGVSMDLTAKQMSRSHPGSRRWTFGPSAFFEKRVFSKARWLFPWSEFVARSLVDDYGVDSSKITVMYPGVDLEQFSVVERSLKHSKDLVKLLFIGGEFWRKGGSELLEAFLNSFGETCELHIVTKDRVAVDHPHIHYYHNVEAYSDLWFDLYRSSDIFVLPTLFEPFGLVYVEAIANSLPVIATDISAIPEIVTHNECGLLVPPKDVGALTCAMKELVDNPTKRLEMGRAARRRAETKFDSRINVKRMEDAFCERRST